jgi:mannose/fructose/N-acetylgalactosamine-specific phosphotransferase system component IID
LVTNGRFSQGSVMGPILFLILVNDIIFNIDCKITIYADNTILISIKKFNLENVAGTVSDNADCWYTSN